MIAVSGATGFLGAYVVCSLLKRGHTVRALKRKSSNLSEFNYIYSLCFNSKNNHPNLFWVEADVLDVPSLEDAFEGVDEVYHCAAVVSFHSSDKNNMYRINVQGTANMVNIALLKGIKKFAYISSIAALGREKSGVEISEQTKWTNSKLNSNYAISKYKAEMEVWRASEEGLQVVVVNPGVILGAGNWDKGSCALFKMVQKGMPFFTNGINGYVDVRDVAEVTIQLMEQNIFKERFVLVSENIFMQNFLNKVVDVLNTKKPYIKINRFLAEVAWMSTALLSFFTRIKPAITKETARASLNQYYYSNTKIKQKINYTFIPIEETINYSCKQLLKQNT